VDSASSDGSAEMVRSEFPGVGLIASTENVGFTKGNNLGIARCTGRHVMLLNPDTEITADALDVMVGWLDANRQVGVVGPRIVQADGKVQPSRRRFPTFGTAFMESTILQQWFPRNRFLARYYIWDKPDDHIQDVDWLEGACLLVRAEALRGVGGFDERFFMYSEELDLCQRIKRAGWRVVYLPTAQILHYGGKSSEQVVASKHIRFQRSKIAYYSKWFGAFRGQVLRAFLLATYVWMLGVESLKWLIGHRRELRAPRIAAYRQVIASRLR
jgi:N-acetylglucosaminyl-diphospho-decaprenol L-rhamnosyltransferase